MFDIGDSRLECLIEETAGLNVSKERRITIGWLWQMIPVRYRAREKLFLFLLSLTRRDNEREEMYVS
jgi:hypothetical protein